MPNKKSETPKAEPNKEIIGRIHRIEATLVLIDTTAELSWRQRTVICGYWANGSSIGGPSGMEVYKLKIVPAPDASWPIGSIIEIKVGPKGPYVRYVGGLE